MTKNTISKILLTSCAAILLGATTASAMSMPIWRPGGEMYQTEDNTKVLLMQRKNTETLVFGPSWQASTKDFGLIIPVPSKPTITEAPEYIFDELESLTNQNRYWIYPMMKTLEAAPAYVGNGVTVVEKRDVGKYTATVLAATDAAGLTAWLTSNGYALGEYNTDNIKYYIDKKGFYFVALKVNTENITASSSEGGYIGRLNPLAISFESAKPYLPTRSLHSDKKVLNFTIFTLTDRPYYIDGSELQFARPLGTADMQTAASLKSYAKLGDWLTRSLVSFDPKEVETDLKLREGSRAVRINSITERRLINPQAIEKATGITAASLAKPLFATKEVNPRFNRVLKIGDKGIDVTRLQYILFTKGYIGEDEMNGVFDQSTRDGLVLLQEEKAEEILKPSKLTAGTGTFGALTRKVLNTEYFK
jgi:Uncharacterized protein conserved in bacteria (DUF2330)